MLILNTINVMYSYTNTYSKHGSKVFPATLVISNNDKGGGKYLKMCISILNYKF